jgi:hypothetical protein
MSNADAGRAKACRLQAERAARVLWTGAELQRRADSDRRELTGTVRDFGLLHPSRAHPRHSRGLKLDQPAPSLGRSDRQSSET